MSTCISLLLCIVAFTTLFGILPLRVGILEGRSVTDPETLPVPLLSPWLSECFASVGAGWRTSEKSREGRRSGFSRGSTRWRTQLPNLMCSCCDQMVLCSHRTLSREVGLSQFLSSNDGVELLQPCSWLSWTFP